MLPKRSFSEKILTKASARKFNQPPFIIPRSSLLKQTGSTQLPFYLDFNRRVPKTETSSKNVKLKNCESLPKKKFQLKRKTKDEKNKPTKENTPLEHREDLNRRTAVDRRCFFKINKKSKSTQKLHPVPPIESYKDRRFLLDVFDRMQDHYGGPEACKPHVRLAKNPFRPILETGKKELKQTNDRQKSKRNIISFDPLLNRKKRKLSKRDTVSKADYMDLFIENMILRKKCEENRKLEKLFLKKNSENHIEKNERQTINGNRQNEQVDCEPLKRQTYNKTVVKPIFKAAPDVFHTPNPKANMCVNYINNNYHMNFSNVNSQNDGEKFNCVQSIRKQINQEWKEKLRSHMNKYQHNKNESNKRVFSSPKTDFLKKKQNSRKNLYTVLEEDNRRRSAKKNKPVIIKDFLEDSTTHKENSQDSEEEDRSPLPLESGKKQNKENFNFTFSNFKDFPK